MKKNLLFNQLINRAVKGRLIYTILTLLCLISGYANAADITITGKVSDTEKGEALPGVSITIKGTSRGATTDGKGDYTIKVPNKNSVLVFSFLGYESLDEFQTQVHWHSRLVWHFLKVLAQNIITMETQKNTLHWQQQQLKL